MSKDYFLNSRDGKNFGSSSGLSCWLRLKLFTYKTLCRCRMKKNA